MFHAGDDVHRRLSIPDRTKPTRPYFVLASDSSQTLSAFRTSTVCFGNIDLDRNSLYAKNAATPPNAIQTTPTIANAKTQAYEFPAKAAATNATMAPVSSRNPVAAKI